MQRSGKRTTYRVNWLRLLLLAAVLYSGHVLVNQYFEINIIQGETEATRTKLEQMQQLNKSLSDERQRLQTPAYVEKIAREELGLVKPGEVPFIPARKN